MKCATISPEMRPIAFLEQIGWPGLRLAILGVVLLALAAPAVPVSGADEAAITALPKEVREALDRAARVYAEPLKGVRWTRAFRLSGTDHALYQVQGTNGRGNKIELEVTSAGRVIEVEEHGIGLDEVPEVVVKALKTKMPQFEPKLIEAIYQVEKPQPVCYGFEGLDANGKKIEVYLSADGKTFLN